MTDIKTEIMRKLYETEKNYDVKIPYAIESVAEVDEDIGSARRKTLMMRVISLSSACGNHVCKLVKPSC